MFKQQQAGRREIQATAGPTVAVAGIKTWLPELVEKKSWARASR